MQGLAYLIGIVLLLLAVAFNNTQLSAANVKMATIERQLITAGFEGSVEHVRSAVDAAIVAGSTVDGPFMVADYSEPACGNAGSQGTFCDGTLNYHIVSSGNSGNTIAGATQTAANLNAATSTTGQNLEGRAFFALTITLKNSAGVKVANAPAHIAIRTVDATSGMRAYVLAAVEGNGDQSGSSAEGDTGGQCDPTVAGCSAVGLDQTAQAAGGAGAGDSRITSFTTCFDAVHAGNPALHDRCAPTGDPVAGPQGNSTFQNRSVKNANGSNGWAQ